MPPDPAKTKLDWKQDPITKITKRSRKLTCDKNIDQGQMPVTIHISQEMAEAGARVLRRSGALSFASSADVLVARDIIYAALTNAGVKVTDSFR